MAAQSSAFGDLSISLSQKVNNTIASSLQDYRSWRSLISEIDTASSEDIDTISLAYDTFLSRFPLCHWHLERYAYQKAKFCNSQEAANIFERAAEVAMYSVGFWAEYFTFAETCFGSPVDIRRLFERAISFVGRDYCCHVLWDKYMKYEFNQEGWVFLAQSYIWALRFPTKKLQFYYDNFKQFVENLEEEIGYDKNDNNIVDELPAPRAALELSKDEISLIIKDMLNSSLRPLKFKALDRYRSIGEEFYREARQMDEKIRCFETNILRRYFDITPLDDDQVINWHLYLDFIEKQDNLDWTMRLYERCLIPCANYPEFWMRYVEFLESKGGRELAISALSRATQIFLKNVPEVHLFDARYKEHIGDADGARAALALCDPKTDFTFIESIAAQANLERRLGNFAASSATYEKALQKAREKQKLHLLPTLYLQFARLKFLITGSAAASRDVFIEGIQQLPHCRILVEELIKFAMIHEGASHVNIINSIIVDALSPGVDETDRLDAKDRENISCLFLEFVNLCGTMHDIREAWNRHVKLFPQSLRKKMTSKHPASDNCPTSLVRDGKEKYRQEQAPQFPPSNGVHPNEVVRKPSPLSLKEKVQLVSTKEILSNGGETRDSEPASRTSRSSSEDGHGSMAVRVEISDHANENALTAHYLDRSRPDEPWPMDVTAELGIQPREYASSPSKSAHDHGKSTGTAELVDASHSTSPNLQSELDIVSLDNNSFKSPEKGTQELIPMSYDEHVAMRNVSSRASHLVEPLRVSSEPERDGSVSQKNNAPVEVLNPEGPSRTHEISNEIDSVVPAPGHATPTFQDREVKIQPSPYDNHLPVNAVNSKRVMNQGSSQQYPARQQHSQSEDKTILDQQRQEPTSYPEQNTNPTTSQQEWQAQQTQMMWQYHYQQYQYQQQQQQNPYYQYMNQQQPYQQQNHQQQQMQMQQSQEPNPNAEKPQEVAYQVHQYAYQQQAATPEQQQLLWQQYQQYLGYQFQQQQQLQQQYHQQAHIQQNFTPHVNQSQQCSKSDYEESPQASK